MAHAILGTAPATVVARPRGLTRPALTVIAIVSALSISPMLLAGTPKAPTNLRTGPISVNECIQMKPGWIFCSGFEEGNKAVWDDYDGNPDSTNLLMEDAGPLALSGNHVMRLRVPPGRGGSDVIKVFSQGYDRLYARWYVKWEPGYDFSALNHGGGFHAGDRNYLGRSGNRPTGSDWFSSWIEPQRNSYGTNLVGYTYYRGMYMDCADPNGSCWGDLFPCVVDDSGVCSKPEHRETQPPVNIVANRWYCVEMMMDGGTPTSSQTGANGTLNIWVDGIQSGPWDSLWLRTTSQLKLTLLSLGIFHHGEHSVEGIMLDNVVVSTSKIGCL